MNLFPKEHRFPKDTSQKNTNVQNVPISNWTQEKEENNVKMDYHSRKHRNRNNRKEI